MSLDSMTKMPASSYEPSQISGKLADQRLAVDGMQDPPDGKLWRDLIYLEHWTVNLNPLMVYPKVLFPPNFIILPVPWLARCREPASACRAFSLFCPSTLVTVGSNQDPAVCRQLFGVSRAAAACRALVRPGSCPSHPNTTFTCDQEHCVSKQPPTWPSCMIEKPEASHATEELLAGLCAASAKSAAAEAGTDAALSRRRQATWSGSGWPRHLAIAASSVISNVWGWPRVLARHSCQASLQGAVRWRTRAPVSSTMLALTYMSG